MSFSSTWERYFFKEALKVFSLFICAFCFLYVLIDYSVNLQMFRLSHFSISLTVNYFLFHLIIEANSLIPAALLLATIKVLASANQKKELIALMAGGIASKRFISPFLFLAILCTLFLYVNTQYFLPDSRTLLQEIPGTHQHAKFKPSGSFHIIYLNDHSATSTISSQVATRRGDADVKDRDEGIASAISEEGSLTDALRSQSIPDEIVKVADHSKLVYQSYDANKKAFFDIFWIRTGDDIYHMKYLYSEETPLRGQFVDHIQRNASGILTKTESFPEMILSDLAFSQESVDELKTPMTNLSLLQLWDKVTEATSVSLRNEASTVLTYKLLMPLICLLAVLIPAPFCMRYDRNLSVFSLYALGIFGFIAFCTVMQSAYILSLGRMSSPVWILLTPMLLALGYAGWQYRRL